MHKDELIAFLEDKLADYQRKYMDEQKSGGVQSHTTSSARGRVEAIEDLISEIKGYPPRAWPGRF